MSILQELGLNPDEVKWQDLAVCRNIVSVHEDENGDEVLFDPTFDSYEEDGEPFPVRKATDEMCLSCPVQSMCYQYGKENTEVGVWGGVYLVNGRIDRTRNEHKTGETWERVRGKVGRL